MHRLGRGNLLATLKELRKTAGMQRRGVFTRGWHYTLLPEEISLFDRLTTLQDYKMPYEGEPHGELFIHWYYCNRSVDSLSKCEIFHLNMLRYFNVLDKVEIIHIRCAATGSMTETMKVAVDILSQGKASVDFKIVQPKQNWEHDTIKEAAEYAVESGKFVYYTHFKGASRILERTLSKSGRENVHPLDVFYWSYIMYEGLFLKDTSKYMAVGPIASNRINREYLLRDLAWSTNPKYQYIGSFQGFNGTDLARAFARLGLDRRKRDAQVWWGGRYTVEMFLTLVFMENEVYSIAQMEDDSSAYRMYTKDFYPSLKSRFKQLYQQDAVTNFPVTCNNRVAICAIAKNEDRYINEWVQYYLSLGVSHIYIYDNNDQATETMVALSKVENVTIIPVYGKVALRTKGYQVGVYSEAYKVYGSMYGWMGFFDIDEFVSIDGYDIPSFLNRPVYDDTHIVHLNWRYFGDNGRVHYTAEPVTERFMEPAPLDVKYSNIRRCENQYVKSFIRTGFSEFRLDIHAPRFFGSVCRGADGCFRLPTKSLNPIYVDVARVNHYGTKSIEEYIQRRISNGIDSDRASGSGVISAKDRLDWFFNVNEITSEKLEVIHRLLPGIKYVPSGTQLW